MLNLSLHRIAAPPPDGGMLIRTGEKRRSEIRAKTTPAIRALESACLAPDDRFGGKLIFGSGIQEKQRQHTPRSEDNR